MTLAVPAPEAEVKRSGAPSAADLLAWYDRHRRVLPWRARAGERPDPYRVWLSEIMLQQTTVKAVGPYFTRFLDRFPTVGALAQADRDDVLRLWAGLGYYARARNLHDCAKAVVERHAGYFPQDEAALRALPGVGPYTAAAIAAIAFDAQATAVDGNVERVVARLFALEEELPAAKPVIRSLAATLTPAQRAGDFAQAMMDLGATICTPKKPACVLCPWIESCTAHRRGDAEMFPRKTPKATGKLRRGAAFVVLRAEAELLVRTRPAKGLLGGMTEVPGSEWTHNFDFETALAHAPRLPGARPRWQPLPGLVRHVFTHFPLELTVYRIAVPARARAPAGMRWIALADLASEALPNLMRKVIAHAGIDVRPVPTSSRL
jgi:A/G-specific adenine glycosylase